VRTDLKSLAEGLGLEPLLSEYDSFPVNPDLGTVDNCVSVVNTKADIFLLIVGGRYGSIVGDDRSITNLEYLAARAKGIPLYAFVSRAILDTMPVWKDNSSGNFTSVADSPKLFEFVESLRDSGTSWVFPFDTAQDIFEVLRAQLAYLFMDALALRLRASQVGALNSELKGISGPLFRIIIEKPPVWEHRLFIAALEEQIATSADQKRDWTFGIAHGPSTRITPRLFPGWLKRKLNEAARICENANRVINKALPAALGPPGEPGDVEAILHSASGLGHAYRDALDWKLDFFRLDLHHELAEMNRIVSILCDNMVREIELFSRDLSVGLKTALVDLDAKRPASINVKLTLTMPPFLDRFEAEQERVFALMEAGEIDPD
jgi:hypothetical protein